MRNDTECTVSRDKVFAVHSLASNGTYLVVSYEESLVDLFLRLMILKFRVKRFEYYSVMHFSATFIDVLGIKS